jgi:LacI family transcriptional regulator
LGYRYNHFAGSLRKQQTNTIGFLVHELNSSFITSGLSGIEKLLLPQVTIFLLHTHQRTLKKRLQMQKIFLTSV